MKFRSARGALAGRAGLATLALAAFTICAGARAEVRRCEDEQGRVTYSNQACPTGTAKERPVENRPPVEVPQGSGEKASRAGVLKHAAEEPAGGAPGRAEEVNREQNHAKVARCDDLVRRIEYGQQDLLAVSAAERASQELAVRRLQDEYQANCARR